MTTSKRRCGPKLKNSLFFSLLAGNLGVETGSYVTASATIFLDFPPIARRARAEHFVSVMLTITEQSDGIGRIAGGCTNWFAGRDSDHSSCRRLVGEVRFDCVTIPFRFSRDFAEAQ